MKKVFFTLALAAITLASNAQEKMWVGGTVGFWSTKVKGADSEVSFKVMPEFGFILSDNLAVGVTLGGGHTHTGTYFDGTTPTGLKGENFYTINPFLRSTFLKGSIGSLFVDSGVAYTNKKIVNGGAKTNELEVGFRPGVAVNVSDKVSLVGKFGFLGYQYAKSGETKANSFGFDLDMRNAQLGVALKF